MRILVVGAGAVGGYFGGRLAEAGREVTFLVRAPRAKDMETRGLQIVSPHGNLTLYPAVITAEEITSPYDLIFLGVKSYSLDRAMEDFAPAVGAGTMILPVLNGMRHMDLLAERFGARSLLGGVCIVATELDAEGRIRQLADFQSLAYGEMDSQRTPRVESANAALSGAGFDAAISDHIQQDMWQKWVQLATLGAINCLLRGNIGQIVAIPGGSELCLSILAECAGIAAACGHPQTEAFLERQKSALTADGSPMTSSMYRDLKKGLPVEVDTILGDLLRRGQRLALKTPLLEAAFVNLSIYQQEPGRQEPGQVPPATRSPQTLPSR
jgi:2-dehydropantoate 2-reductase